MNAPNPDFRNRTPWSRLPCAAAVFLLFALPLIVLDIRRGRGQFDQELFHEPTVRAFAEQLGPGPPPLNLSDYASATAPGFHLVLAAVCRGLSDSLIVLKLCAAIFTVALLWLLERSLRRRLAESNDPSAHPPLLHLALIAPLLGSMYVFVPGVWLQPDNAGWLGVLAIMLIALRPRWDWLSYAIGAVSMLLLVWMRQSHIWAAGVLWLAAWIGGAARAAAAPPPPATARTPLAFSLGMSVRWLLRPSSGRIRRTALAFILTLPAFATLAWFYKLWGGLTPPRFQQQHGSSWNPTTPAFTLSLFAIFSMFFIAWVWPGIARLWRERRTGGWLILIPCILVALLAAAIPATTYLYEARATGLWNLVRALEDRRLTLHGHTSPLILILAPLGAIMLAAWLVQLPRRRAWVYGLALLGFTAAQSANANAWQRYLEPMLLMTLALMAADLAARPSTPLPPPWWVGGRRALWLGPALLGLLGASLTAFTIWKEPIFVNQWGTPGAPGTVPAHGVAPPPPPAPAQPSAPAGAPASR